ncbi:MAG TPA: GNAT family N-acetyltransferase [Pyrinomonadaceae bacterium]|jgi:phosphinothricin acetyltransferase|nr:GNAT family N-acetyltransferase [Pyrinomonadaceae bacterium]
MDELTASDWEQVHAIYLEGLREGNSTFEIEAPSWETWDEAHLKSPRLVMRVAGKVLGWAALSPVSKRSVYSGVAEVSIYVAERARGKGIGRALLEQLVKESEHAGIWTLQASIFPENAASIQLHLNCGFREVGKRERIAKLKGVWRDTILFERRSKLID